MRKKISVIVPVYNMGKYLPKCVESLVGQTYGNVEIILIDDGSTDDSGELCDGFASRYDNIIVFHQKNSGVSQARNKGLGLASGDYISFVDPDDFLDLRTYEKVISLMERKKAEIGCFDNWWFAGSEPSVSPDTQTDYRIELYRGSYENAHLLLKSGSVCRCIFFRKTIKDIRFCQKISQGEDVVFLTSSLVKASCVLHIEAPFYFRRETPNSATRSAYNKTFLDVIKANKYIERILLKEGENYKNLANCVCFRHIIRLLYTMRDAYLIYPRDTQYVYQYLKIRFKTSIYNPYLSIKEKVMVFSYCLSPSVYYFLQSFYHKIRCKSKH